MFFFLTNGKSKSSILDLHYRSGWVDHSMHHYHLYLDDGWHYKEKPNEFEWHTGSALDGHFCIIQFSKLDSTWRIFHDSCHKFPIFYANNIITNVEHEIENSNILPKEKRIKFKNTVTLVNNRAFCPKR